MSNKKPSKWSADGLIYYACKEFSKNAKSTNRAAWFEIKDKKSGQSRCELAYIICRDKNKPDHVVVRRMNDEIFQKTLYYNKRKMTKICPLPTKMNADDIIWFLKCGFASFVKYQGNRADQSKGAIVLEGSSNIPRRDISKYIRKSKKTSKNGINAPWVSISVSKSESKDEKHLISITEQKQSEPKLQKRQELTDPKQYEDLIANFAKKLQELQQENEKLQKENMDGNSKRSETNLKIGKLKTDLNFAESERERLGNKVDENKEIMDANKELIANLRSANQRNQKIENNIQQSSNEKLQSTQKLCDQYVRVNKDLKNLNDELQSKYEAAKQRIETFERDNAQLSELMMQKETANKELKQTANEYKRQIQTLEEGNTDLQKQYKTSFEKAHALQLRLDEGVYRQDILQQMYNELKQKSDVSNEYNELKQKYNDLIRSYNQSTESESTCQTQLQQLSHDKDELQNTYNALLKEYDTLKVAHSGYSEKMTQVFAKKQSEMKKLKEQQKQLKSEISKHKTDMNEMTQKYNAMESNDHNLHSMDVQMEYQQSQAEIDELEADIKKKDTQIKTLQTVIEKSGKDIVSLQQKLDSTLKQKESENHELNIIIASNITKRKEESNKQTAEMNKMKEERKESDGKIAQYMNEIDKLKQENTDMKQIIADNNTFIQNLKNTHQSTIEQKQAVITGLNEDYDELTNKLEALETLEHDFEKLKTEKIEINNKFVIAQKRKTETSQENQNLKRDKDRLKKANSGLRQGNHRLQTEIDDIEQNMKDSLSQLDVLGKEHTLLKSNANEWKNNLGIQKETNEILNNQLNESKTAANEYKQKMNEYLNRIQHLTLTNTSLTADILKHKNTMETLKEQSEDQQTKAKHGMEKMGKELRKYKKKFAETEDALKRKTDEFEKMKAEKKKAVKDFQIAKTNMMLVLDQNKKTIEAESDNASQELHKINMDSEKKENELNATIQTLKSEKYKSEKTNKYTLQQLNESRKRENESKKRENELKQTIELLNDKISELSQQKQANEDEMREKRAQEEQANGAVAGDAGDAGGAGNAGDAGDDNEQFDLQKMSKQTLQMKYKEQKTKNLTLQKQIMRLLSPSDDKSDFPVMEDIRADYDALRKQYYTNIFDDITGEIGEQYEYIEEKWEQTEDDCLFDAVVDREARRVLFNLLHITYHFVRMYKYEKFNDIIESVSVKFELKSKKAKTKMSRSMAMVIKPYFQSYYNIFSRHRYIRDDGQNNVNKELESGDMNIIIDRVFKYVQTQYNYYRFWEIKSIAKQFQVFIAKTCELCWIMVLHTPQLYFFPHIFSVNDNGLAMREYDTNVEFIYSQKLAEKDGNKTESKTEVKKRKKRKKKRVGEFDKDEEADMDEIVKEHNCNPFDCAVFDDKYHDCLNETGNEEDDGKDNGQIIDHNGMEIKYCGWPSMIRVPQLESDQHTQITKTFAYFDSKCDDFMNKMLPTKENIE